MEPQSYKPIRFVEEAIDPVYLHPPVLEKKPSCPDGFHWRDAYYRITSLLMEWRDYERRGRYSRNMQPQHASVARSKGSWGVGKFYFRVITDRDQIFDIYYDRSPKDVDARKGSWHIYQELVAVSDSDSDSGSDSPLNSSSFR